jgi:hypothetical protein
MFGAVERTWLFGPKEITEAVLVPDESAEVVSTVG